MAGSFWWGQVLNALAAKNRLIHASNFNTFSGVGGKGISEGNGGEGFRLRHPHAAFSCLTGKVRVSDTMDAVDDGNSLERRCKSINAFSDNKQPRAGMSSQKYISCFVSTYVTIFQRGQLSQ